MDGWQVRVNCKGEMVILQAQPPALCLGLCRAAEVSSSACEAPLSGGSTGEHPPPRSLSQCLSVLYVVPETVWALGGKGLLGTGVHRAHNADTHSSTQ